MSGEPCIAFGLLGDADGTPVADAEGGDFDLELESGDLVHVSLEHATLEAAAPPEPSAQAPSAAVVEVLCTRGAREAPTTLRLAEVLLRDGDRVTVDGAFEGGPTVRTAYRDGGAGRVFAGTAEAPLVVHLLQ